MFFATSAMSCCSKKSIKLVPTSIKKQLSNRHSNLHRFWSQLGSILGGFWRPRWDQIGTKSIPKSIRKWLSFWTLFGRLLGLFWRPFWTLSGAEIGPSSVQDAPGSRQEAPRSLQNRHKQLPIEAHAVFHHTRPGSFSRLAKAPENAPRTPRVP